MPGLKNVLITITILFIASRVTGQDILQVSFPKITAKSFDLPASSLVDKNTEAIFLSDAGRTVFVGSKNRNWVSFVFRKHTRIKIFKRNATELATFKIRLYGSGNNMDVLDSVEASTYNVEGGNLVESKLDAKDIFENRTSKTVLEKKFTLPGVKEGSIIDISYRISSQHYYQLPEWYFQHFQYPCLYSEYEITIPNLLSYLTIFHGLDSFYVNQSEKLANQYYQMSDVNVKTIANRHRWAMKDIPGFQKEDYVQSPSDCLDKLEFHLSQTYNGEAISNYSNTWQVKTDELLKDPTFGHAIIGDALYFLEEPVKRIVANGKDQRAQAKLIYEYVRDNFTCTDRDGIYIETPLYDVFKNKKGSAAEINLLLIAMLRQNRIVSDPVILGTRSEGINSSAFPVMNKINAVICITWLSGDTVYLDASHRQLGFGRLWSDTYNGHARIIDEIKRDSLFFYPEKIKEAKMTTVFINNTEKSSLGGTYDFLPGYFGSDEIREDVLKEGQAKYISGFAKSYLSDLKISASAIDSLHQLDFPVNIHLDFDLPFSNQQDLVYFNPVITKFYSENPYKSIQRKFPIEMDYPVDEMYILNMEIPGGYEVEELPKSSKVSFNNNEGFYEYLIAKDDGVIQLRTHLKLIRATYFPEEYNSLRDFYGFILKKQSEQIVFKKKK